MYFLYLKTKDKNMKCEQIWTAIDKLAKISGMSLSNLAKKSGLDSTTFNKSKRIRTDGRQHWPSLESINKILNTCQINLEQFCSLIYGDTLHNNTIPCASISKLSRSDQSKLDTSLWNKTKFRYYFNNAYALILDNYFYEPLYNYGTILLISKKPGAAIGDRTLIIMKNVRILIKELVFQNNEKIQVCNPTCKNHIQTIPTAEIRLINRIIGASQ